MTKEMNELDILQHELEMLERDELKLLRQLEKHQDDNPLLYFKPHPKQQPVFDAALDPTVHTIVFQGGNRSGKTHWLIAQLLSLILGYEPWSGRHFRFKPPIRARLFGEDWTHHIGEVLIGKLKELCPKHEIKKTKRNNAGIEYLWFFENGSILEIMTYEQKTDIVEGWSGHVVAADEPMPRDKYIACKRGLVDYMGLFLMSMTPLKEPWIFDEIVSSQDKGVVVFYINTHDNPYLDKNAINEFEKSLTEEERETRIKGQFLHLQGLVYKEFDKRTHIIRPFEIPENYTVYVAIDSHPRTEQAVIFMAVDRKERYFVFKEIFEHGRPEDIADWIIRFHLKEHPIEVVLIEPGAQGDTNRGESTFEIVEDRLGEYQIQLEKGSKDLSSGILKTREALLSRNGLASLFIFDICTRTIFEFTHYVWDDWRVQGRAKKQRPKDQDDHMLENIHRLLLHPAEWVSPIALSTYLEQTNYTPLDAEVGY